MAKGGGPREYSWEVRERAEELYIVDGLTYEQVAQATGVSMTQIQRWAAADGWQERRREYRQALTEIRRGAVELRRRLIGQALQSLNPQDVYAVARMEAIFAKNRAAEAGQNGQEAAFGSEAISNPIRTPQEAVQAIEGILERKLNGMLTKPGTLTLAGLRDLQRCLELLEHLKIRYKPTETEAAGTETGRQRLVEEVNRLLGVE